ncbi:undecaprenyl-phosphate glucose phosphotransferase [Polaromonas jejuensis]|uniref:Undecaprenyl-phosphate glucose phosphotransferase n=1 Tax=Polaromonas jejuensis TaxID=457502 RepID=A0ABW0Q7D8_9BURK|nr:undecaprenyl-phosphate glucose phosphotransferase [Polaromonas jejuensis]
MLRSPIRLSSPVIRYVAMALDALIIWGCGLAAYLWYHGTAVHADIPALYKLVVLAASLMLMVFSRRIYRSWRVNELGLMLRSVVLGWLGAALIIVVWLFLAKSSSDLSRVWFVGWVLGTLGVLSLQRLAVYGGLHWLRRQGYNFKTAVIVGAGQVSQRVQEALAQSAWSGLRVVATLPPEGLVPFIAAPQGKRHVDEVWLCLPLSDEQGIRTALEALRHSTANIRLVPDMFALTLINHGISEVVGIPMLDLSASPITGSTRLIKAVQDYVLALFILLLISPLMLGIALAIKLTSRGPVLYRQRRHGWNGEEIWVYKFRSMVVHQEKDFQVTQARKNDARITPLGAFLRRTSLDELPQFFNVLQGRMSIVGPRPHAVVHNEHYKELVPGYMLRHKVKPGITGWAQINGFRGETDTLDKMQKRVEYDLHYIENLSLWLDLKIILATVFKGFVHKNAY